MTPEFENNKTFGKEELFYSLLQKSIGYYKAILEITKQERELLQKKYSMEELKPLIKKKQVILTHINQIEMALSPLKKYWAHKFDKSEIFSLQIQSAWAHLNAILLEILTIDQNNQQTFKNNND